MDQTFPPASLGGIPRELRDMITDLVVEKEDVIYHQVTIAENQTVSFKSFTTRGYRCVCRQFREEYAETFNKHIQHLASVGDIDGKKLFDPDRFPRGFRSKIALVRKDNSPLWECHPVLPSLRHLKLLSSFTSIAFEAFQGHYTMAPDEQQKISVSFQFPLSSEARKRVRHQESSLYNHIFNSGKLEKYMQSHSKDLSDISQVQNKRFKPSVKAVIAVQDILARRKETRHAISSHTGHCAIPWMPSSTKRHGPPPAAVTSIVPVSHSRYTRTSEQHC